MKHKTILVLSILFLTATSSMAAWQHQKNPQEYDTMTIESYNIELQEALDKEERLRREISAEEAKIDSLKQLLVELDEKIAQVIQEKYDILGITEADVIAAKEEIAEIRRNLELLLGITPEELLRRKDEITENEDRIIALKEQPVSLLWEIRDLIKELDTLLERVKNHLPDLLTSYEVQLRTGKRDCLYRIAGYEDIYEDASRWPEIYRANRQTIDRDYDRYRRNTDQPMYDRPEDLIFPGQVFEIPR
jgi:chromosome segregation ATPase